ncbi:MAG TPA: AAA family ATPase [Mycobacteriales bacterium]|nr:AAA family ATPase [Mycobacteriales bacterium]
MRGREHEWDAVAELLRAAEAGRGGTLLVEGGSGTGKSLLLGAAGAGAEAMGFGLAAACADELGELSPLSSLFAALEDTPAAPAVAPGEFPDLLDLRLWRVEQLRARLQARAADHPLLVTLDDLHWADPTSLTALWTLRWQLGSYPVAWILARDADRRGAAVARLFAVLERDGARRVELGPLAEPAVLALVARLLGAAPDAALRGLCQGAGGNPRLLVELVEGLREEGALRVVGGRAETVATTLPRRVQVVVGRRLDRLSGPARQLVETAAVLGRSFAPEDAAEMLGETTAALLPALEEALSAGVLVTSGAELAFGHEVVWQAVLAFLPEPFRAALHRQVGELLLARGGAAVPAATHLVEGGRRGDARALAGLDRAIGEVVATSPQAATALAVRTLELTDVGDPQWLPRALRAVDTATEAGRLADAAGLVRAALALPLAPAAVARLRCALAGIHHLAGRAAEAATEAEAVLGRDGLPADLRDRAELALIDALSGDRDDGRGERLTVAVLATTAERGDAVVIGALIARAVTRWDAGCLAEALALTRRAVNLARSAAADGRRIDPRLALGGMLADLGRLDEADAVVRDARKELDSLGHLTWMAGSAVLAARLDLAAGHLDEAVASAEGGLATAAALGTHLFTPPALVLLAEVALRRGDLLAAAAHLEGVPAGRAGYAPANAGARRDLLAARLTELHDGAPAALTVLTELYARLPRHPGVLAGDPAAAGWLVRVALAAGDRRRAGIAAAAAESLARDNPQFPVVCATAAHARGLLAGEPALLREAVRGATDGWARASAAEDLADLLTGPEAIDMLDAALDGYDRNGSVRDAARVRRRLRRKGVRHRHWSYAERPVTGWDSLTETECSVSVLVAQGRTNREIAGQMYVSAHTVAYHVRQVFRKLGVHSRVELTRVAVEGGHLRDVPGRHRD